MELLATDLSYKVVKEKGVTFDKIIMYGEIIDTSLGSTIPAKLEMNFVSGHSIKEFRKQSLQVSCLPLSYFRTTLVWAVKCALADHQLY